MDQSINHNKILNISICFLFVQFFLLVRVPFERLVEECRNYGILSLVDGAHGIGHVPLDLGKLDADFFVISPLIYRSSSVSSRQIGWLLSVARLGIVSAHFILDCLFILFRS